MIDLNGKKPDQIPQEQWDLMKEKFNEIYEDDEPDPTPVIKDSGSRQEFESGAVRDIQEGKGRCDLMPLDVVGEYYRRAFGNDDSTWKTICPIAKFTETGDSHWLDLALIAFVDESDFTSHSDMFLEVSKHFEDGAKKYGENNWQKGLPLKCYINSAVRHYLKWLRGDTDEHHDRAFCWNILCAIWTCKHKPELNDYAVRGEIPGQMDLFEGGVNNADD